MKLFSGIYILQLNYLELKHKWYKMTKAKQEEFMAMLEPLHDRLNRFVRAMNYDREEAKDVVSETLMKAYESFDKLKNKETFLSYLFTIAYRTNIKYKRKKKFFGIFDNENTKNMAVRFDPDKNLEVEQLYRALDRLPSSQKQAVILFEISGFSIEEIAGIQGGSLSGVKSRLKRGREKLAEVLLNDERFIFLESRPNSENNLAAMYNVVPTNNVINYQVKI